MIKLRTILLVGTLTTGILLSGCGAKTSENTNSQTDKPAVSQTDKGSEIKDGITKMREVAKDMKTQLDNKENDKAVETEKSFEENWQKIEDGVKEKAPDLYKKVEGPLDALNAGVKVSPLDVNTLKAALDELDGVLAKVQELK